MYHHEIDIIWCLSDRSDKIYKIASRCTLSSNNLLVYKWNILNDSNTEKKNVWNLDIINC